VSRAGPPASISLPQALAQRLIDTARGAGDYEICGFLGQSDDASQPPSLYPVGNLACSPHYRFDMDPVEQIAAFKTMRQRGEALLAIYHSHPDAPAEPSSFDLAGHSYPEAIALIISPSALGRAQLRAWVLDAQRATPLPLHIEPLDDKRGPTIAGKLL